ncbi:MAG: PHP domain-containing protein [Acidimicrobiia bacterium]
MAVDLHLHSTASDGTDTPTRVVQLAAAAGLTTIALTDHDRLDGIAEARAAAADEGIEIISGTELSVDWESSGAVHMLVYYLEPGPGPLQNRLVWLQEARQRRNLEIVDRLTALGLGLTIEEVEAEAGGMGVGRPHFAAVLIRKGYAANLPEAFDRWLAAGRPGYAARDRLHAADAIRLARASDAVPVIAHPHTIGISADEYRTTFERMTALGLGGIESYYAEYQPRVRAHLATLCDDLGIVATGGSDYHGGFKPEIAVGVGRGDLLVPDEAVEKLAHNRAVG